MAGASIVFDMPARLCKLHVMSDAVITLVTFLVCYVLFVVFPTRRSVVACAGAALLVIAGPMSLRDAVFEKIDWNVMGLFFGTLILAEIFMHSRVPAVLAEKLIRMTSTARAAMLMICALSGLISIFVENVAVVMLVAPVALSLADRLKINPVKLLIGIAISSNLQGTATMIGDPPSMILAGYLKLGFLDFFLYQGRPSIFFAVEIGAIASLIALAFIYRTHRQQVEPMPVETALSWIPSWLLVILVAGLSVSTMFDPEFEWFAGVLTIGLALVSLAWLQLKARWIALPSLARSLDWDTTFFLAGVFVLVGGLSDSGWLRKLAAVVADTSGGSPLAAFAIIVVLAVLISGFVDNVPFLLAMIPVARQVAESLDTNVPLLMFGLLIGACLGGNLTPIGASANVVTLGILRRRGHTVRFREFMGMGIPITAAAVLAACAFVWLVWSR